MRGSENVHSEAAEAAAEEALTAAAAAELERDPLTWRIDSENDEEWKGAPENTEGSGAASQRLQKESARAQDIQKEEAGKKEGCTKETNYEGEAQQVHHTCNFQTQVFRSMFQTTVAVSNWPLHSILLPLPACLLSSLSLLPPSS